MLQARVRQLWRAWHQHRWPWLVYHEVGTTAPVPLQDMRWYRQHEYGHGVQRPSLYSQGVRASSGLRVEGVSISATARITGRSRNTVARWLERVSTAAERFNRQMLRDFEILELQAEELCTFIGNRSRTMWLFAIVEVSSLLWTGSRLGRRSYRNTTAVLNDVLVRGRIVGFPLIATDGSEYYFDAIVCSESAFDLARYLHHTRSLSMFL